MDYVSAGSIVQQAATQLRLCGQAYSDGVALADPFSSSDPNIVRLCSFLGTLGQEVRGKRRWQRFSQNYLFSTISGQGGYPLPPDFDRIVDQTGWNRTNRLPLGGPISLQDRSVLQALLVNVTFTVLFDQIQGQFQAYPDNTIIPGNFLLAYWYQSLFWVSTNVSWQPATPYAVGQIVTNNGNTYACEVTGTSAAVGASGPTGTNPAALVVDGTVSWVYVAPWAQNVSYANFTSGGNSYSPYISANGNVYSLAKAGVSSSSGTGPFARGVGVPEADQPVAGVSTWNWAAPAPGQPNTKAPTLSADIVFFDQPFMVLALERKYRIHSGWPLSDEFKRDYEAAKRQAEAADVPAKMLALDRKQGGVPLIGSQNVPYTGFGL